MTTVMAEAETVQQATGAFSLVWLLVALPLAGAGVLLLGGRRTDRWGPYLGVLTVWVGFVVGAVQFLQMVAKPADQRAFEQVLYSWAPVGSLQVDMGFLLDQLSLTFVLLVTFVGGLIHVYSLGYMRHDPDRRRFFAYLNLFVASMLMLVVANNYVMVYVGWEGVGLASYLLIGFWNQRRDYATAANKAFVMNRVGDLGMSLAIMVMFATFGTVGFTGVFGDASKASTATLAALGLLLLLAAVGKSAQLPLQAWLFDAMAGPTPVSALIHAATMVTAGVYLVVRSNAIFDLSSTARTVVAIVGALTLLFGALVATAKDDIKKALAGSTMSQIGYMVLAAGLGPVGYPLAIMHLVNHGFFKADLFLGAGSVMHGMDDELDMRRYGALRKALPVTYLTFMVGYLSIIGIPPFSGFFSKDKIIEAAFGQNTWLGLATVVGAAVTAFYMTRVVAMTYFGDRRWKAEAHPHESPSVMTMPMVVLSVLSVVLGLLFAWNDNFVRWLEPVTGVAVEGELPLPALAIQLGTLVLVVAAAVWGFSMFARRPVPQTAPVPVSPLVTAARNDLYEDAFNETVAMRPGQWMTRFLVFFDNRGVDGAVNGLAAVVGGASARLRRAQTGFVRSYGAWVLGGAVLVVGALVLVRL